MTDQDIEKRIVFGIGGTVEGPPLLVIGIPKGCWEHMKDGKTSHLDLTRIGVPVKLVLFGAESHDAARKMIEHAAAQQGEAVLDLRREDFSMKDRDGKPITDKES